jgi:hypothetical protein
LLHQLLLQTRILGRARVGSELVGLGALGYLIASLRDQLLVLSEDHLLALDEHPLLSLVLAMLDRNLLPLLGSLLDRAILSGLVVGVVLLHDRIHIRLFLIFIYVVSPQIVADQGIVHYSVVAQSIFIELIFRMPCIPFHQIYHPSQQNSRSFRYLRQVLKVVFIIGRIYIRSELPLVRIQDFNDSLDEGLLDLADVHEHQLHLERHGVHHLPGHCPVRCDAASDDADHVQHSLHQDVGLNLAPQFYYVGLGESSDAVLRHLDCIVEFVL